MKKYTISFDDKKTNKTYKEITPSTNYSAIIDDIIRANIKKNNPYLFGGTIDEAYRPNIAIIPSTKKTIDIDITIPKKKSFSFDFGKKKIDTNYENLFKAIAFLSNYDSSKDNYDFKTDDGTPIKLFADEIQIGYDLIPLNNFTKKIYDSLSDNAKKSIIDIYITINK